MAFMMNVNDVSVFDYGKHLLIAIPYEGFLCDILWPDPDKDVNDWAVYDRGVSFLFGQDVVTEFLNRREMDLICRAHQVVENGYEFFCNRRLVTLFSVPNYCGEFNNTDAVMSVDEDLTCSIRIFKPFEKKDRYQDKGTAITEIEA
ncbi:unnamed protein product [Trichobilharzia szidati]|nr:unnamed protein product [Trichobilharzia szidati]